MNEWGNRLLPLPTDPISDSFSKACAQHVVAGDFTLSNMRFDIRYYIGDRIEPLEAVMDGLRNLRKSRDALVNLMHVGHVKLKAPPSRWRMPVVYIRIVHELEDNLGIATADVVHGVTQITLPNPECWKAAGFDWIFNNCHLLGLCEIPTCRRVSLLAYFDQQSEPCGNCDTCCTPPQTWNATVPVRQALRWVDRTGNRYPAAYIIRLLMGESSDRAVDLQHDMLAEFGIGANRPTDEWRGIIRQLLALGLLTLSRPHRALCLTDTSRALLKPFGNLPLIANVYTAIGGKCEHSPFTMGPFYRPARSAPCSRMCRPPRRGRGLYSRT